VLKVALSVFAFPLTFASYYFAVRLHGVGWWIKNLSPGNPRILLPGKGLLTSQRRTCQLQPNLR